MKNKYLKVLIISLSLSGLLGVMACASGGGPVTPMGPTAPSGYENPSPVAPAGPSAPGGYLNPSPTPADPEFWKMWESAHGLG